MTENMIITVGESEKRFDKRIFCMIILRGLKENSLEKSRTIRDLSFRA
jgi:hypothetical protein